MTQTSRGTTKSNSSLPYENLNLLYISSNQCIVCSGGRRAPDRYRSLKLLGAQSILNQGRKCLVLDLDETLVHSSFQVCLKTAFYKYFCNLSRRLSRIPTILFQLRLTISFIMFTSSRDLVSARKFMFPFKV